MMMFPIKYKLQKVSGLQNLLLKTKTLLASKARLERSNILNPSTLKCLIKTALRKTNLDLW
jgi:hypothetical protein